MVYQYIYRNFLYESHENEVKKTVFMSKILNELR